MPIQATVILDSGCFLKGGEGDTGKYTEIGYFGSSKFVSYIRVFADGMEKVDSQPINLGKKCRVEVQHLKADGEHTEGVKALPTFHGQLLHMKDLYGQHMPMDHSRFDCVLRFESGNFCGSFVKPRYFAKRGRQANGRFEHTQECGRKPLSKPIAHNVVVHFKLNEANALELARDGEAFWSSKDSSAKEQLVLRHKHNQIGYAEPTKPETMRSTLRRLCLSGQSIVGEADRSVISQFWEVL
jgi:hypothetical protein